VPLAVRKSEGGGGKRCLAYQAASRKKKIVPVAKFEKGGENIQKDRKRGCGQVRTLTPNQWGHVWVGFNKGGNREVAGSSAKESKGARKKKYPCQVHD